jgi:hypothetical protein
LKSQENNVFFASPTKNCLASLFLPASIFINTIILTNINNSMNEKQIKNEQKRTSNRCFFIEVVNHSGSGQSDKEKNTENKKPRRKAGLFHITVSMRFT